MNLTALPAFTNDYIWILRDGRSAVVVDPGEAAPGIKALDSHGLEFGAILVTHRHVDLVGRIDALRPRCQANKSRSGRLRGVTRSAEHRG